MIESVKEIKDDLVNFTQEMIRIPSLTGDEGQLANAILTKLQSFEVDEAFIDGIGNVCAVIHGTEEGLNVLMNGHLDVVPGGNRDSWGEFSPFGGEIDPDGNIHGRGAADVKGGLSVQLYTMKLMQILKKKGIALKGKLIFSAVVHEEAAEMFGMEYLCAKTLPERGLGYDVVFLCEPSGLNIVLGQRGKVEIVVNTFGKSAHSSVPEVGVNALEKMIPVLNHIFNNMQKTLTSHPILGRSSITVTNLICRPGKLSIIPDECEISIDRRYMPGEDIEDLLKEFEVFFQKIKANDSSFKAFVNIRKIIERSYTGYEKEVRKYHPPWIIEDDHAYVQRTISALRKVGQRPKIKYWKFGTDGSYTAALNGIPTIGYSGTDECYAHTSDEKVNITMMVKSLEGYYSIVAELLGVDFLELK